MKLEIKLIKDKEIKKFTKVALKKVDKRFWIDPCSSTGKYHPPEDQGKGGIIRHTKKAVAMASELCRYYNLSEYAKDLALSATILHDITKNGIPWTDYTDYTHGLIAYHFLEQFKLREPEKRIIREAVRYHMWRWIEPESELERALNPTLTLEKVVQLSDFIASRQCASYLPSKTIIFDPRSHSTPKEWLNELAKEHGLKVIEK